MTPDVLGLIGFLVGLLFGFLAGYLLGRGPRHTVRSVSGRIVRGLQDGSVTLEDGTATPTGGSEYDRR